jgi:hypothetical protein
MNRIRNILKTYSNTSLATITGYPVEHIHMLRKNDIDHFAIKTDPLGRGIPTRSVMENIIEQRINNYERELERKYNHL